MVSSNIPSVNITNYPCRRKQRPTFETKRKEKNRNIRFKGQANPILTL